MPCNPSVHLTAKMSGWIQVLKSPSPENTWQCPFHGLSGLDAKKVRCVVENTRRSERLPLRLEVRLSGLSGHHGARTSDISLGGCYIETIGSVTAGERVQIEFQLPTGAWVSLQGEVVYCHPNLGFGVRFLDVGEQELAALRGILS
jgi:hypothetical protein